ncbi:MAG: 50S ribosomal protein L31 [Anaerolineae bacterium]|nr:50S ribosomal protein L31 [Anaerolineae bacterium]
MKNDIHPTFYFDAVVTCACGNTWTTGSTKKEIRTDICSNCHPLFTGEQRIVDTEGQVDRFYKRLQARQDFLSDQKARAESRTSPDRLITELEVSSRVIDVLDKAGIKNVGEFMEKLGLGEDVVLAIDGFGRKSLADMKKRLRQLGYKLPETETAVA